jgi:hypothetical protein
MKLGSMQEGDGTVSTVSSAGSSKVLSSLTRVRHRRCLSPRRLGIRAQWLCFRQDAANESPAREGAIHHCYPTNLASDPDSELLASDSGPIF